MNPNKTGFFYLSNVCFCDNLYIILLNQIIRTQINSNILINSKIAF